MAVAVGVGVDVAVEFGIGLTVDVGGGVMVAGGRLVFVGFKIFAGDGVASLGVASVKAIKGVVLVTLSTAEVWQPISSHIKLNNAIPKYKVVD